jgi:hypothetical protein
MSHAQGEEYFTRQQQPQPPLPRSGPGVVDSGFRYKLVPQQDAPPTPYAHQPVVYRDSSSEVSSNLYQKLPLGSSAASPNGLAFGGGPAAGAANRGTPDSAQQSPGGVNYLLYGGGSNSSAAGPGHLPPPPFNTGSSNGHLSSYQSRPFGNRPLPHHQGNGIDPRREYVHFSNGMTRAV